MKLHILLIILAFSFSAFAQTDSQNLPTIDQRIESLRKQQAEAEAKRSELLVKYKADSPQVKEEEARLERLNKAISGLLAEKNGTAKSNVLASLGDSDAGIITEIFLLKKKIALCGFSMQNEGCADGSNNKSLAAAYRKAANSPNVMNYLLGGAIEKFDGARDQTRSAPQVSQIADEQNAELMRLLVVQNQKIIELLEILVKKK